MSWHRLVTVPKKHNIYIHYTLEAHDNVGLVSTLAKKGDFIILDFSTPLSSALHYDKIIEKVIKEASEC
ncbi:MAG: hypothetical protein R6W70_09570 [bacterium]